MKRKFVSRLVLLALVLSPVLLLTGCDFNDVLRNPVVMVLIVIIAVIAAYQMQKKK